MFSSNICDLQYIISFVYLYKLYMLRVSEGTKSISQVHSRNTWHKGLQNCWRLNLQVRRNMKTVPTQKAFEIKGPRLYQCSQLISNPKFFELGLACGAAFQQSGKEKEEEILSHGGISGKVNRRYFMILQYYAPSFISKIITLGLTSFILYPTGGALQ